MNKIECIVMDWAGTAVDYGCFAPVAAFEKAFAGIGLPITTEEARRFMGMAKIDHIRELFRLEHQSAAYEKLYGRKWREEDVREMNRQFETYLFASLEEYTQPIPGVVETIGELRESGLKIGSTTGYTRKMMEVVVPGAAAKGYVTDACVTPDGLPAGRPQPYMIYRNLIELAVPSVRSVVKYGDTLADIREGVSAGVWTVGVVAGSNEMGLTWEEAERMDTALFEKRKAVVRHRMLLAGAHYTVDTVEELPGIIEIINNRMNH